MYLISSLQRLRFLKVRIFISIYNGYECHENAEISVNCLSNSCVKQEKYSWVSETFTYCETACACMYRLHKHAPL
jgi:hypothetical protein